MFKDAFNKKKYFSIKPEAESLHILPEALTEKLPGGKTCPQCLSKINEVEYLKSFKVCPSCGHHFTITAWERVRLLADENSFSEFDHNLRSCNFLEFSAYEEKLSHAAQESGLNEAIITGYASISGYKAVLGIMESRFMMGSMGSVVGEKVCRAAEKAMDACCPLILCTCSGGARMQEGMVSLMQMAKTSAVLKRFHAQGLLYISVLTHPTTGGVSASFASLADLIIAEPGALVGFTGPRVIEQTVGQRLPEHFQRSEFLLEHGMIDLVVPRARLTATLGQLLAIHQGGRNG